MTELRLASRPASFGLRGVKAKSTHVPSVSQGGVALAATEFGAANTIRMGTSYTKTATADAISLNLTVNHVIGWDVRTDEGPNKQKNIASESAEKITKKNFGVVAADLTPNEANIPPRTAFWAKDLTTAHELVHAADHKNAGAVAISNAMEWLNEQRTDDIGLSTLIETFANMVTLELRVQPYTQKDAGEEHAYGVEAAAYKKRADSIRGKGNNGEYK